MLEPIRTQNLGSLLMKLSQSNFNLRSPDCYSVRSYLIAIVFRGKVSLKLYSRVQIQIGLQFSKFLMSQYKNENEKTLK